LSTALDTVSEGLSAEALDRRFRKPLTSFFFRRTNDWNDAEDLTQQTFLRLHQIGDAVDPRTPDSFVFAVASFMLKEHWSRQRRENATSAQRAGNVEIASCELPLADGHSPELSLLERDQIGQALKLLEELGPRTRGIYLMFRVERMKHTEIAALYGISVSAVKKHVIKAAAHLARGVERL
jgi:RNA polymerase sigma-70 factor (ECF subfamily)